MKKEYNGLAPIFRIKKREYVCRVRERFTQEEVAKRMKTSKSNISRLESLNNTYTAGLNTLIKYAEFKSLTKVFSLLILSTLWLPL